MLHCGACGHACLNDEICEDAECVCPPGKTDCDGICTDLETDESHCGVCDNTCEQTKICDKAECSCRPGETECAGVCTDLTSDEGHCGTCSTVCTNNLNCLDSRCGCPPGFTDCNERCVALDEDPQNCGSCGSACPANQFCSDGACLRSPCDLICDNPESAVVAEDGIRMEPLGLGAHCFEVGAYNPSATDSRIVCWGFNNGRTLRVNGASYPCLTDRGSPLGEPRAGGYCIQVTAGGANFAGLLLPTR
jgi:hypothetical protein